MLDNKFTNIATVRHFAVSASRASTSNQLHGYIRFQADVGDVAADNAEGTLLYPALNHSLDEAVVIQGHIFRFVTVDLGAPSVKLRSDLLDVVRLRVAALEPAAAGTTFL